LILVLPLPGYGFPGPRISPDRFPPGPFANFGDIEPVGHDDEIRRLRREVDRLSNLLREHGIEPGEGDRKSA
jgi:hypothetical protein